MAAEPTVPIAQPSGALWLVGMMGAGKSTVGRMLGEATGRTFVDLDWRIEETSGRSIAEIFEKDGEAAFRALEAEHVLRIADESAGTIGPVVAAGGGAPTHSGNLELMRGSGLVVWLRADVDEVLRRLDVRSRPLLARAADARARLLQLESQRRDYYRQADLTIDRGERESRAVADEILKWLVDHGGTSLALPPLGSGGRELSVELPSARYHVLVDTHLDAAQHFAARLARIAPPGRTRVGLVTDENVERLHGTRYLAALQKRGFRVMSAIVPAGEESKSLGRVEEVCEALALGGLDRRSLVVALGGGVVGDLAGFVAAILFRGIAWAHVPTTLLAQVDASVGGKTGVNLVPGKNLVGAFHQPSLVLADVGSLATLDARDLRSGLGEIVKHAFLEGGALLERIEARADDARAGDRTLLAELIASSVELKARIVAADERESLPDGGRALLNLGHTIGHALETASARDPETHGLEGTPLRHGEAVALGLLAAARLGKELLDEHPDLEPRLVTLLGRLGLPVDLDERLKRPLALAAITLDKKRAGGQLRLVLLEKPGAAKVIAVDTARVRTLLVR